MDWLKQSRAKSQLGQLLLKNRLISEDQLERAIDVQRSTGQMLGDIFTQLGMVSQRQVQGMLRRQRYMRRVATIVTALLGPMQVYAADVAPVPVEQVQTSSSTQTQRQGQLRELNESELSEIAGQGLLDEALNDWLNLHGTINMSMNVQNLTSPSMSLLGRQTASLEALGTLVTLIDPLLGLLSAQVSVDNVVYDPAAASSKLNGDGSVSLTLPSSVGELSFQNIRLVGSTGPSMGNISIQGVNLGNTTVTLKPH